MKFEGITYFSNANFFQNICIVAENKTMAFKSIFKPSNGYENMGNGYPEVDHWSDGSRNIQNRSYKERNTFGQRVRQVENLKKKYPYKVAIIIERFDKVSEVKFLLIKIVMALEYFRRNLCPLLKR